MEIKEITKLNLQDGDIIFLPAESTSPEGLKIFQRALTQRFSGKEFLVITAPEKAIRGIKVIHMDTKDTLLLTLQKLKSIEPKTIFAKKGTFKDGPEGINIARTGQLLKWVAVKGDVDDWAIYCQAADWSDEEIRRMGDKIQDRVNIMKLVPCDNEALSAYRH